MMTVLPVVFLALVAPLAAAETITVNSMLDLPDADAEDGVCDADLEAEGLQCTLRAAVMHANTTVGSDTIELPAGVYKLTLKGVSEDACATGDLDVLGSLTIEGEGADVTIIDGKKAKDRILDVFESGSLTLRDVTLRKGVAYPPPELVGLAPFGGGGIRCVLAPLVLERVVVSRCRSYDDGGGIELDLGQLTMTDCTIERCRAGDDGAGLDADDSQVSLNGCTFFRNRAKDEGGALENSAGQLSAENCTFFGNSAKDEGGAMSLEDGATSSLAFCTLLGNRSKKGAGVSESDEDFGVNVTSAMNTIFGDTKKKNCSGTIGGDGNVDTGTSCGFDAETNQVDTKPLAKKAAFNGGVTRTCALKPTSPCVDAAFVDPEEPDCPETDQRGEPRDEACDVGAYELIVEEV